MEQIWRRRAGKGARPRRSPPPHHAFLAGPKEPKWPQRVAASILPIQAPRPPPRTPGFPLSPTAQRERTPHSLAPLLPDLLAAQPGGASPWPWLRRRCLDEWLASSEAGLQLPRGGAQPAWRVAQAKAHRCSPDPGHRRQPAPPLPAGAPAVPASVRGGRGTGRASGLRRRGSRSELPGAGRRPPAAPWEARAAACPGISWGSTR